MRRRTASVASLALALHLAGCSDDEVPADTVTAGIGGAGGAAASTASSTVVSNGAGGETPNGVPGIVGRACQEDADCSPGRCILPTTFDSTFGGAPARGYCTIPCQIEFDCPDPGSACFVNDAGQGECLLGCTYGEPELLPPPEFLQQPLDPAKCHGRDDVGCTRLASGLNVCWPACSGDVQCEAGLVCDPFLWSCVESKTMGGAFGNSCVKSAPPPECEGYCIGIGATTMCSQACPIGGVLEPDTPVCGGLDRGACVARSAGIGLGDIGFCGATCKQQDDCRTPDLFCYEFALPDGHGICRPAEPCTVDADCTGSSCVATIHGSFCMSTSFPLGSIAPP